MKSVIRQLVDKSPFMRPVYRAREYLLPSARQEQQDIRSELAKLYDGKAQTLALPLKHNEDKTVILVGGTAVSLAAVQAPFIVAARLAGYKVYVLLSSPSKALEETFLGFGASDFIYLNAHLPAGSDQAVTDFLEGVTSVDQMLEKPYLGIHSGRFALSTFLRHTRSGRVDFSDDATTKNIRPHLERSLRTAVAMNAIVECYRPDYVAFYDRGYTPEGELFEAALNMGSRAITMNTAHRGGLQLYKKYGSHNADRHPAALSSKTWSLVQGMEWTDEKWQRLYDELKGCYVSGQWYDEVGTQFGKKPKTKEQIISSLGLDPNKKTAVLFAHIFWDATFFWGDDLFEDYEDWFVQSLKIASENKHLNWIFKAHPANFVKDKRDGYAGERVEMRAVSKTLGELPDHIKILEPESEISTFSLFEAIEYCITVRGTVGMEAACLGVPVVTAGTGRYDRLGFTHDHDSTHSYIQMLRDLHELPGMSQQEVELARRYMYAVLIERPLPLNLIEFSYEQDDRASLNVSISSQAHNQIDQLNDVQRLCDWLQSSDDDLLVSW